MAWSTSHFTILLLALSLMVYLSMADKVCKIRHENGIEGQLNCKKDAPNCCAENTSVAYCCSPKDFILYYTVLGVMATVAVVFAVVICAGCGSKKNETKPANPEAGPTEDKHQDGEKPADGSLATSPVDGTSPAGSPTGQDLKKIDLKKNSAVSSTGSSIDSQVSGIKSGVGSSVGSVVGSTLDSKASGMGSALDSKVGSNVGSKIGSALDSKASGMGSSLDSKAGSGITSGMGSALDSKPGGVGSNMGSGMGSALDSKSGSKINSKVGSKVGSTMESSTGSKM